MHGLTRCLIIYTDPRRNIVSALEPLVDVTVYLSKNGSSMLCKSFGVHPEESLSLGEVIY